MNGLRAVDLNLLVILDALLDEAHVTRAAARLGLSQPATSSALDRLRHLYGDPLLERGKGRLRLTPAAEALREPLKAILVSIAATLNAPKIDLRAVRRTVRLAMADNPAVSLVADLHRRLSESAPGLDLVILPWRGAAGIRRSTFPWRDGIDRLGAAADRRRVSSNHAAGGPLSGGDASRPPRGATFRLRSMA